MNYARRALIAREYLEGEFCAVGSDDDGIVESSILKMEKWLTQHPAYSSVGGICIGAFSYGGIIASSIAYQEMHDYKLINDSVEKRLEVHLLQGTNGRPPRAALYRLFRRGALDKILEVFGECSEISTPYVYEVCAELVSAWAGPTRYINQLYWIRNWQTEIISKKDWNRRLSFNEWWNSPIYAREKTIFIQRISEQLSMSEHYLSNLISEYTNLWKEFFQSATPAKRISYPEFARLIGQKIKVAFFPKISPNRIEDLLSKEFGFLSSTERQEVLELGRNMFLSTKR
jgi:hypothetical protein